MIRYNKSPDHRSRGPSWWQIAINVAIIVGVAALMVNCSQQVAAPEAQPAPQVEQTSTPANQIVGIASVVDGDTIEIHGQRIRPDGIDAPEEGKRCGDVNVYQRASLALADIVGAQTVTCTITDRPDRYGREVAQCSVGGVDIGTTLVQQGWARDWPRYSDGAYAHDEATARAAHRGIWGSECPADLWGD